MKSEYLEKHGRWELIPAALLMAIPAVVLYFLGQRFVVAGLTGEAVKG